MNALKLAERLAEEQKQLAKMIERRKQLLEDSQTSRYGEWVAEHAAVDAVSLKKDIDDKKFLIEGIRAKLEATKIS